MCYLTALFLQISLIPFQTIPLEESFAPNKIIHANDSVVYLFDQHYVDSPIIGFNYKTNSYFSDIRIGSGPLEINIDPLPMPIYVDSVFYVTDRTQNKVVVYNDNLEPIDEYVTTKQMVQYSFLFEETEVSQSLSPSQPLFSRTKGDAQLAPSFTNGYLTKVRESFLMRQFTVRHLNNTLFGLLNYTDYVLSYDLSANAVASFKLNVFDDLPDPKKHNNVAPDGTDYAFGGLDFATREGSSNNEWYILFKNNKPGKLKTLFAIMSGDESFLDEVEHSNTMFRVDVDQNSGEFAKIDELNTEVPINSIFFVENTLLALTYLDTETPKLLCFEVD